MDLFGRIFNWFWIELVVVVWAVVSACFWFKKTYLPKPIRVEDSELPENFLEWTTSHEHIFRNIGFSPVGNYDCSIIDSQKVLMRFFISSDRRHLAMLCETSQEGITPERHIQFCTQFKPYGRISTNNSPYPNFISMPKTDITIKLHWIKDFKKIYEQHIFFCEAVDSVLFKPVEQKTNAFEQYIYDILKREYIFQVKKKRMKRVEENVYALTIWGAIVGVPLFALYFLHSYIFRLYKPDKNKIAKKIRTKFKRMQMHNYGPC
jgi:hypothetical protein